MDEDKGRQFVGTDLRRQRSVIVRQSESGEQLSAVRIVNDPVALEPQLENAGTDPEVVLEAMFQSPIIPEPTPKTVAIHRPNKALLGLRANFCAMWRDSRTPAAPASKPFDLIEYASGFLKVYVFVVVLAVGVKKASSGCASSLDTHFQSA